MCLIILLLLLFLRCLRNHKDFRGDESLTMGLLNQLPQFYNNKLTGPLIKTGIRRLHFTLFCSLPLPTLYHRSQSKLQCCFLILDCGYSSPESLFQTRFHRFTRKILYNSWFYSNKCSSNSKKRLFIVSFLILHLDICSCRLR